MPVPELRPTLRLTLAFSLLGLASCQKPVAQGPVDAFVALSKEARAGDGRAVFERLSKPTQSALAARVAALRQVADGGVPADPVAHLLGDPTLEGPPSQVTLLKEEGEVAMVKVEAGGASTTVRLVKEPSGWKLDLTDRLATDSKATAP
jgi:hypothetical protein